MRTFSSNSTQYDRAVRILVFYTAFATLFLLGCEADFIASGPSAVCTETAVQCQLADGPLGVCERAPCEEGAVPPCFQCTSQH